MPPKLGILAGGGELPRRLLAACTAQGREVFVIAFEGDTDPATAAAAPHCWVRLGAVGRIVRELKRVGAEEVVLAGPVRRPSFASLRPDLRGIRLLAKARAAARGDDSMLALAIAELEAEGFRVVGAHELLGDLLAAEGPLGRLAPDAQARADIDRGLEVAVALGRVDVGQAVVVQHGLVLGVEAAEGTDALLERCASLRAEGLGGVLVKIKKPNQDSRADLPTIGVNTVLRARSAGLRGIAVEAGATLVLDAPAVTHQADEAGLFLIGIAVGR